MFTIRKATTEDIPLIHTMAKEVFPATYADILSPEQLDYMMEWMYSITNLRKQMEEEGHIYYIAFKEDAPAGYVSIQPEGEKFVPFTENLCTPFFPRKTFRKVIVRTSYKSNKRNSSRTLQNAPECKSQ